MRLIARRGRLEIKSDGSRLCILECSQLSDLFASNTHGCSPQKSKLDLSGAGRSEPALKFSNQARSFAEVIARGGDEGEHAVGRVTGNQRDLIDRKAFNGMKNKGFTRAGAQIAQGGRDQP